MIPTILLALLLTLTPEPGATYQDGICWEADGTQGLYDLAASFAILESSTARRTVTLDEVLTGQTNAYQADIDQHYGL